MSGDPLAEAYEQVRATARPIDEIAAELGLTRAALDRRLERRFGKRSRQIRTGEEPTPGRPAAETERTPWAVRLTAEERRDVEAAVARERAAGAPTDGAALQRAVTRSHRRS